MINLPGQAASNISRSATITMNKKKTSSEMLLNDNISAHFLAAVDL